MLDLTGKRMQVSQTFPANWLERQTIYAFDDKVVMENKSILQEYRWEYSYAELSPKFSRARSGDAAWSKVGWSLIWLAIACLFVLSTIFPNGLFPNSNRILPIGFLLLAFIAFAMRFVKQDQVWFYEKDGSFAFLVKLSKRDREHCEQVAAFIAEKIKGTEPLQVSEE